MMPLATIIFLVIVSAIVAFIAGFMLARSFGEARLFRTMPYMLLASAALMMRNKRLAFEKMVKETPADEALLAKLWAEYQSSTLLFDIALRDSEL
jgi:uncharacterized membrane protein YfcA